MIRKAVPADASAIAEIHVATWRTAYADVLSADFLAGLSAEKRAVGWQRELEAGETVVVVAEEEGVLVGFASGGSSRDPDTSDAIEIFTLYVLSSHWDRGIGRRLMETLDAALPTRDQVLWVLRDNARARGFYEKLGFRPDGAEKDIQLGGRSLREIRLRRSCSAAS